MLFGGKVLEGQGFFVEPTIVEIDPRAPIVKTELFVPILCVARPQHPVPACLPVFCCFYWYLLMALTWEDGAHCPRALCNTRGLRVFGGGGV